MKREQQQEEPLGSGIVGGDEFPGRVDHEPEQGRAAGGVQQHDPAVAAGQNVVAADVVKGEGEGRQQGGEQADGIEPQSAATEHSNHQSNSCDRQSDRRDLLQRGFLQPASDGVEQYPDRGGVLHDDRGGNVRPLNRQIVEVVGGGHAQNADQEELAEVTCGQAEAMASPEQHQDGQENEEGKCGAALGENQGIDGVDLVEAGQAAGEGGAAEGGGDAPEERGGGDVQVAADGLAGWVRNVGRLQQKLAELCSAGQVGHLPLRGWCDYLRLSVLGSGWIRTRNSSGNSCLKRISSSVEMSCTLDSGRSSAMVQWAET